MYNFNTIHAIGITMCHVCANEQCINIKTILIQNYKII
jgi:hypothetical protein